MANTALKPGETHCQQCRGEGHYHDKLKDQNGNTNSHIIHCYFCYGKGVITEAIRERERRSWEC